MRISHDDPSIHNFCPKAKKRLEVSRVFLCQHDSCLENPGRAKFFSGVDLESTTVEMSYLKPDGNPFMNMVGYQLDDSKSFGNGKCMEMGLFDHFHLL